MNLIQIRAIPYLLLMLYMFYIREPILKRYYKWRNIPTKRTAEGFIERK